MSGWVVAVVTKSDGQHRSQDMLATQIAHAEHTKEIVIDIRHCSDDVCIAGKRLGGCTEGVAMFLVELNTVLDPTELYAWLCCWEPKLMYLLHRGDIGSSRAEERQSDVAVAWSFRRQEPCTKEDRRIGAKRVESNRSGRARSSSSRRRLDWRLELGCTGIRLTTEAPR